MFTDTRTYTDYDGNERTEDFRFNLTKAEVLEMEMYQEGGMEQHINRVIAAKDSKELIDIFKAIIDKSYGVKSEDGKRFIKSPEILAEFKSTEAYSDIFMELATDDKKAIEFIEKVLPDVPKNTTVIAEKPKNTTVIAEKPNPIPPTV